MVCWKVGLHSFLPPTLSKYNWHMLFLHPVMSDSLQPPECNMPGLPVCHHLLEFAQVHVHCISDAIQPSHPLTPSSALNLSEHQGPLQWLGSSHQLTKLPELRLQHQSFQWIFRVDFLWGWLVGFPCYPRDSQESSPAPQFKSINSLELCLLYNPVLTTDIQHCVNLRCDMLFLYTHKLQINYHQSIN